MPLFPQILITNQSAVTDNGIVYTDGDVYITITDEAGKAANGNNMEVTVAYNDTGNIINTNYSVPGQSLKIYSGLLSRRLVSADEPFDYRNFAVVYYKEVSRPTDIQGVCDANITSVSIVKKESAPGAGDGQIAIDATSSFGPIQYKIDSGPFQTSRAFTGLSGGVHTAAILDSQGCTTSLQFTIPVLKDLLVADPSIDLGNGNISRWNAAFNPIIFCYQRKDFEITAIALDIATQRPLLTINGIVNKASPGELVYVNAGSYNGVFAIYQVSDTWLIIDTNYTLPTNQTGFININSLRAYYKILTRISYTDRLTRRQQSITAVNRPDSTGLVKADFSNFLQSLLSPNDNSDYTQACFMDCNLAASYQIAYAESWDDGTTKGFSSAYIPVPYNYYVAYAAKQLGQPNGGNLALYVPFASAADSMQRAQWLSDFSEPAFSQGYPFDISFIYSEYLRGLNIYLDIAALDINQNPLLDDRLPTTLLNEDGTWLMNEDSSRFIVGGQSFAGRNLQAAPGLNRILINTTFPTGTAFFTLTLKYKDEYNNIKAITESKVCRIDDAVDQNSVYLRWIGLSGSWNYYRFVYNQEISLDVQNATIIKNYVSDWANQQGIEEVIAKQAGQKMKVMAEDLSVNDIKGLQSIKYSPKVQLLGNKNPVKWQTVVINTATYSEYETLNGQAPFSITFNLPSINIQTQ